MLLMPLQPAPLSRVIQRGSVSYPHGKDDTWMQSVAAEMKHSETAFIVKENNGYQIRYFTPTTENSVTLTVTPSWY